MMFQLFFTLHFIIKSWCWGEFLAPPPGTIGLKIIGDFQQFLPQLSCGPKSSGGNYGGLGGALAPPQFNKIRKFSVEVGNFEGGIETAMNEE